MEDSPLSESALATAASNVRRAWRLVESRAPESVRARVAEVLEAFEGLGEASRNIAERRRIAVALEGLEDELRGRSRGNRGFYERERLGVIRMMEPVSIRETIDDARVREHLDRYDSRARRALERLAWFLERAGVETQEGQEIPDWEKPYADFAQSHEHVHDD
mgnify:FL=1